MAKVKLLAKGLRQLAKAAAKVKKGRVIPSPVRQVKKATVGVRKRLPTNSTSSNRTTYTRDPQQSPKAAKMLKDPPSTAQISKRPGGGDKLPPLGRQAMAEHNAKIKHDPHIAREAVFNATNTPKATPNQPAKPAAGQQSNRVGAKPLPKRIKDKATRVTRADRASPQRADFKKTRGTAVNDWRRTLPLGLPASRLRNEMAAQAAKFKQSNPQRPLEALQKGVVDHVTNILKGSTKAGRPITGQGKGVTKRIGPTKTQAAPKAQTPAPAPKAQASTPAPAPKAKVATPAPTPKPQPQAAPKAKVTPPAPKSAAQPQAKTQAPRSVVKPGPRAKAKTAAPTAQATQPKPATQAAQPAPAKVTRPQPKLKSAKTALLVAGGTAVGVKAASSNAKRSDPDKNTMATKQRPTRNQYPNGLAGARKYNEALQAWSAANRPAAKPAPKAVDRRRNLPGGRNNPATKTAAKTSTQQLLDSGRYAAPAQQVKIDTSQADATRARHAQLRAELNRDFPVAAPPKARPESFGSATRSPMASRVSSPVAPAASPATAMRPAEASKTENKPSSRGAFDTEAGKALMGSHNPGERASAPAAKDAKANGDEYSRLKNAFYDADSPRKAAIAAKALQQYRAAMERNKGQAGNSTIVN